MHLLPCLYPGRALCLHHVHLPGRRDPYLARLPAEPTESQAENPSGGAGVLEASRRRTGPGESSSSSPELSESPDGTCSGSPSVKSSSESLRLSGMGGGAPRALPNPAA